MIFDGYFCLKRQYIDGFKEAKSTIKLPPNSLLFVGRELHRIAAVGAMASLQCSVCDEGGKDSPTRVADSMTDWPPFSEVGIAGQSEPATGSCWQNLHVHGDKERLLEHR